MWVIYKHTNKINGKVYIGQTRRRNIKIRWKNGKGYNYKRTKTKFYNAIKKYGWDNFTHEILRSDIPSQDLANELEQHYIELYDSVRNGYNTQKGGTNAYVFNEDNRDDCWTKEEIELLKQKYPFYSNADLLALFPKRTYETIKAKAKELGIQKTKEIRDKMSNVFSDSEIKYLKDHYPRSSKQDILNHLKKRSWSSITQVCSKYNIARDRNYVFRKYNENSYNDNELRFIQENYKKKGAAYCANKLGVKPHSIYQQAQFLGLTEQRKPIRVWTKEEKTFLKNNVNKISEEELAIKLNRSIRAIHRQLLKLNLITTKKKVLCVETNTIYHSIQDAIRKTGNTHICDCCKGKRETAGGYHWKYIN